MLLLLLPPFMYCTCETSALKLWGSKMANSDSILRFSCMFSVLKPFMNQLYFNCGRQQAHKAGCSYESGYSIRFPASCCKQMRCCLIFPDSLSICRHCAAVCLQQQQEQLQVQATQSACGCTTGQQRTTIRAAGRLPSKRKFVCRLLLVGAT